MHASTIFGLFMVLPAVFAAPACAPGVAAPADTSATSTTDNTAAPQVINVHPDADNKSICGNGKLISCCKQGQNQGSDGDGGLLNNLLGDGLLNNLLGGQCETVAINILGAQNIKNSCGTAQVACCTGKDGDIDSNAQCDPVSVSQNDSDGQNGAGLLTGL